jgi:ER membrane protein complex subunit 10
MAKGPVTEEITLYLSSDYTPYQISYALRPYASEETVVRVVADKSISRGPEPVLSAPVVVNPDGTPPVQEQEKTFIQKYWMYMLPVLLLVLTSGGGGGGEEQTEGRAQRQ